MCFAIDYSFAIAIAVLSLDKDLHERNKVLGLTEATVKLKGPDAMILCHNFTGKP